MDDHKLKRKKAVPELDRFKRRLILTIGHLLVRDKKPEQEVWEILKRDTGCNCKLLWSRMRALTLKKLERHLIAEDRVDRVPSRARMNIIDWMMVDHVLVHQDLDFIGQDLNFPENFSAFDELFNLVNMFEIEGLKGEALAEAWSSATLHYNTNGHQCSPLLLQKRWYQMKANTRSKFYNFWYAYKGCIKRLHVADPYKPTPLEHAIARRYKSLITSPHLSWEELIEQRLVTLPDEFERKMMERAGFSMHLRRASYDDASDLVLVEPRVETIDLRQESDEPRGESKKEETTLPPMVRVKQEPPDPDLEPEPQVEVPKKSIYEEVLESTLKENQVIDAMLTRGYFDVYTEKSDEIEAVDLEEKHEMMMPQITCVFSNVSEGNLDMYSGTDKNTLPTDEDINKDTAKLDDTATVTTEGDVEPVTVDNKTPTVDVDGQVETVEEENGVIQLDDADKDSNVHKVDDVPEKVDDLTDKLDKVHDLTDQVDDLTEKVHKVTDIVKIYSKTVTVQDENHTDEFDEDDLTSTPISNDETNVPEVVVEENTQNKNDKVFEDQTTDVVAPIRSENETINKNPLLKTILDQTEKEIENDVEVIEDVGSMKPVVITDSEDEPHSDPIEKPMDTTLNDSPEHAMEITEDTTAKATKDDEAMNEEDSKANVKIDALKFSFGELPQEFSFVDDGIELADDGIAFDDYDDHIEIKTEPETEEPKIDPKLLMVPVVYVTRLEDLNICRNEPLDQIRNKDLLDAVIINSLPIKQEKISKQEPEDIIEDTPITPADDNVESMSTDEDSNDSVIPENVKVKPTSYLLQKPRSRSYNPIQLCKNPDFNTRLKRLTVGFFKSHRNRALIKHCKPLTIDMSKAFETKLINGTLYLKPESTDDKLAIELTDDSEIVQNATVVPSAMIAQSLIDNTKTTDILPLIREAEMAPKPTEHERNTRINLPDISEIRRINQRLLTAEITPIQVQNKTFQAPVTLISNEPAQSPVVISTPTADVTMVHSAASENISGHIINSLPESSTRGQVGFLRGHGRGSYNGRKMTQSKFKSRPFKSYTAISWLSKSNDPVLISKEQETLLTLDTVNKILNILGDKDLPNETQKKQKGSDKNEKKIDKGNQMANNETQAENNIDTGVCKLRINVKSAENGPRTFKPRKKRGQETGTTTDSTNGQAQPKKRLHCCWSRQRMLQLLFSKKRIPDHDCREGNCICCCRQLLWSYIAQEKRLQSAQKLAEKNNAMCERDSACAEAASACENLNQDGSRNADKVVGPAVTKVSASQINLPLVPKVTVDSGAQTEIRPNVSTVGLGSDVKATTIMTTTPVVQNLSAPGYPTITVPLVDTLGIPMIEAQPVSTSDLNLTKSKSLKTYTNSIDKKPYLPTQTKSGKPFKPPKFLKEKLIFLNSKHISEKPTKNPIYLGKNKVLMTTVKFPWNLKLFEETKQALASTLKLPAGISLVCLPDGTVSYSIDNVQVKAVDLAMMPFIIATVQMHMNNALLQQQSQSEQNDQPIANSNEVIDLVDDEDEDHKKTEKQLDTNNSTDTNDTGNVMNSTVTTCIQDNAQVSQDKILVSEAQLLQTDLSRTDASQSQEVTIEMESTQSDPPNLASNSQLQPTLNSTEDQNELVPTNQSESIEAVKELPTEPGQPKENEDKAEKELLVEQSTEQAQPGHSSQLESLTVTQEFHLPTNAGQPNQTEVHESVPTEVQSQPDVLIQKPPTENTVHPEQSTHQPKKTKNILSDLMEMSGIFDDDVAPTPQETLPIPAQQETLPTPAQQETLPTSAPPPLSILSQMVGSVAQPVIQPTAKLQGTILGPIPNNYLSCQPLIKTPLGDLSPITSLYELKYACANKGIFFKLDFDTGYLVPINVCLKAPVKQQTKVVAEKAVIDLTSEGKSNQPQPNRKRNISLLSPRKGLLTPAIVTSEPTEATEAGASLGKPCSLVKVGIPSILRRLNADNKCQENINTWIKERGHMIHKRKRKQLLQHYDLNDTEYSIVLPSSKKATKRHKSTDSQEPTASTSRVEKEDVTTIYDSSDDEPLSKVANLKRQEENKRTTRIVIDLPTMEQEEQLDDDMDIHENIPELDQSYSSDDDEENCILGV
ncbi:uncharacterized protein LOC111350784 isoform X2 [Spodoptera litura]|uniref:Uncharacterized protein LOC111350784 isoform X2 n=1 Tax=Spodoptera litura TaxID=69820 RepID=A0A9J7DY96_SPOLT|nr:uncharacterized protein LOC111350784 isoform X2 [Spodoptera litura]